MEGIHGGRSGVNKMTSFQMFGGVVVQIAAQELHAIGAEHNHHYAAAKRHIDDCLTMKMVTLNKAGKWYRYFVP